MRMPVTRPRRSVNQRWVTVAAAKMTVDDYMTVEWNHTADDEQDA
ncbi:hypothetical protein [Streptomyces sp. MUSC 125]|nr:hypothetical protein [Streptomyces sp. MUSC 125]